MKKTIDKIKTWLSFIRLPNLFTIPGDPVCGFFLSGGSLPGKELLFICFSSLCSYIFGLIGNDLVDFEEDKVSASYRPLPSGAISLLSAKIANSSSLAG